MISTTQAMVSRRRAARAFGIHVPDGGRRLRNAMVAGWSGAIIGSPPPPTPTPGRRRRSGSGSTRCARPAFPRTSMACASTRAIVALAPEFSRTYLQGPDRRRMCVDGEVARCRARCRQGSSCGSNSSGRPSRRSGPNRWRCRSSSRTRARDRQARGTRRPPGGRPLARDAAQRPARALRGLSGAAPAIDAPARQGHVGADGRRQDARGGDRPVAGDRGARGAAPVPRAGLARGPPGLTSVDAPIGRDPARACGLAVVASAAWPDRRRAFAFDARGRRRERCALHAAHRAHAPDPRCTCRRAAIR